jgi:hypothetical protein
MSAPSTSPSAFTGFGSGDGFTLTFAGERGRFLAPFSFSQYCQWGKDYHLDLTAFCERLFVTILQPRGLPKASLAQLGERGSLLPPHRSDFLVRRSIASCTGFILSLSLAFW